MADLVPGRGKRGSPVSVAVFTVNYRLLRLLQCRCRRMLLMCRNQSGNREVGRGAELQSGMAQVKLNAVDSHELALFHVPPPNLYSVVADEKDWLVANVVDN